MKTICKYIVIPMNLYSNPDLTVLEKWVLLTIDSYCSDAKGVAISAISIASASGINTKEVKKLLKSLQEKGAIICSVGENGEKIIKPLLYKERYTPSDTPVIIGDKPTDSDPIPYDEIAEKWAEICSMMPPISRWTPVRKRKLKGVLKQAQITVQDLYKAFEIISMTPFLRGDNSRDWGASFNWLLGSSMNVTKILEGYYSKSPMEKRDYDRIMNGGDIKQRDENDIYR